MTANYILINIVIIYVALAASLLCKCERFVKKITRVHLYEMLCLSRVMCYNLIYLSILILVIVSPHVNVSCFPYVHDLFTEIKYLMRLNLLASLQSNFFIQFKCFIE